MPNLVSEVLEISTKISQVWCYVPVVPPTQQAEAGGGRQGVGLKGRKGRGVGRGGRRGWHMWCKFEKKKKKPLISEPMQFKPMLFKEGQL